jgi:hypothetical protein
MIFTSSDQILKIFAHLDSTHQEDSNDIYLMSVTSILTKLFIFKILY